METVRITQHIDIDKRVATLFVAGRNLLRAAAAYRPLRRRRTRRHSTRELRRVLNEHVARDIGLDLMTSRYGDHRTPGGDADCRIVR